MQKKGRGNAKHELTMLQVEIPKLGKLSRSPGYGGLLRYDISEGKDLASAYVLCPRLGTRCLNL